MSAVPARVAAALALVAACDEPGAPPRVARWTCPDGWVAGPRGGCGPASLLCDPQRGACPSARAWREPGDPEGPPVATWQPEAGRGVPDEAWSPEAGIPRCAPGWRLVAGACDPALRADCPEGSVALPGGICAAVAEAACATDAFPDPDPAAPPGGVARVRAGADPAAADGSAERPFATIAAALARVGDEAQVLVARGAYPEALEVTGRARVTGRCGVTLTGAAGRPTVLVRGAGASLALRRVAITGGASGAVAAAGAALTLRDVRITGVTGIGVDAEGVGTTVRAEGLVVTGTVARRDAAGRSVDGDALVARGGARLDAVRVLVEGNQEAGVYVADGVVTLADSVVRGTQPRPDGEFGQGILVETGGSLTAARTVVEGSYASGAQATGARATLRLEDCVVRGTRSRADGRRGWGVVAGLGARVEGARVLVADNRGAGALAADAGSSLTLTASVVRGTRTDRDSTGYGLLVRDGAALTARAVVVEGSEGVGAYARGGATLTLDGAIVRATAVGTVVLRDGSTMLMVRQAVGVAAVGAAVEVDHVLIDGEATMGVFAIASPAPARAVVRDSAIRSERADRMRAALVANAGGTIEATRVLTLNCGTASANASGEGASITLDDCALRRTRPGMPNVSTGALQALSGGALTARRVLIEDSAWCGAFAKDRGSRLTIEDSAVRRSGRAVGEVGSRTAAAAALLAANGASLDARRVLVDEAVGSGVEAIDPDTRVTLDAVVVRAGGAAYGATARAGAAMEARRTLFEANGVLGVYASDDGTTLSIEDSVVRETLPAPDGTGGNGLTVMDGASLTVARSLVEDNTNLGVLAVRGTTRVTLTDTAIRGTRPPPGAFGGGGVLVGLGAELTATRVLLARNHAMGIASLRASVRLDDVTVSATQPVGGLFGAGVIAAGAGVFEARRLALVDLHGVAFSAGPGRPQSGVDGAPRVTLDDVFIRGVRSSAVSLDPARDRGDTSAAYGLYCGPGCALAVTRAVIDDGDIGFFVAQGALSLRQALIARQLDTAGAVTRATPAGALSTAGLTFADNLSDGVRADDALPLVDALPGPTTPCLRGGCP